VLENLKIVQQHPIELIRSSIASPSLYKFVPFCYIALKIVIVPTMYTNEKVIQNVCFAVSDLELAEIFLMIVTKFRQNTIAKIGLI
jgi:hypothetical protein